MILTAFGRGPCAETGKESGFYGEEEYLFEKTV